MPSPDALRASLDHHEVDRKAGKDRLYVESVLRRIHVQEDAPKEAAGYGEGVIVEPTDDTPSFSRVKPVEHPKQKAPTKEVEFREVSGRKKRKKDRKRKDRDADAPVIWEDVTEGVDPARKPDPKAGFMKGNYALLRRQLDSDHAVYFFATEVPDDAEQTRIPNGYEVRLTEETNLPYIARRGKSAHLNQTAQVRAKDRDEAIEIAASRGIGGIHPE